MKIHSLKNISILIILIFLAGCSTLNKAKVFLPSDWIGMQKIAPNLYVNKDMSKEEQKNLISLLPKAKKYVEDVWGEVKSNPTIYACSTQICADSLGIGARAHSIKNYVVLSPRALTKELIAHEWSHAELYERIDSFMTWRKVPSWFDEGLAVLVSHEPRHDKRAWKKIVDEKIAYPSLNELITLEEWTKATKKYNQNIMKNDIVITYATAGHEVSQWYKKVGIDGLNKLIKEVKKGNFFEVSYRRYKR